MAGIGASLAELRSVVDDEAHLCLAGPPLFPTHSARQHSDDWRTAADEGSLLDSASSDTVSTSAALQRRAGARGDPDHQMRRLNETPEYRAALVDIRLATPGGTQKAACIRRYEAAWWLINLDDARCKSYIRGHLQAIKQRLMDAADAILFGDIERSEEGERGILMVYSRYEFTLACLDCGAVHRVVIVNGEPTVTLEREA